MKLLKRRTHGNRFHEFEQRRALSPRDNQPLHLGEIPGSFDQLPLHTELVEDLAVRCKIALESQNTHTRHLPTPCLQ